MKKVVLVLILVIAIGFLFLALKSSNPEKQIRNYIDEQIQKGDLQEGSVFVQDLESGKSYGVNTTYRYSPASMFKVPTVMTYLYNVERNHELFSKQITYTKEIADLYASKSIVQYPAIDNPMQIGKSYPANDLIVRTIGNSENEAVALIRAVTPLEDFDRTAEAIGLELRGLDQTLHPLSYFMTSSTDLPYITAENFNKVMVSLYNGTYLTKENSTSLLELLANTNFPDALVAGVPSGVKVSHKFGTYGSFSQEKGKFITGLNDCGIVYTEKPYSVCVMLVAKDMDTAKNAIKDISNIVYKSND